MYDELAATVIKMPSLINFYWFLFFHTEIYYKGIIIRSMGGVSNLFIFKVYSFLLCFKMTKVVVLLMHMNYNMFEFCDRWPFS